MATGKTVAAWLKQQGWTFTEMTEAQKTEMRATLKICGYATSSSKRTKPCSKSPAANGRCKTPGHGGAAKRGIHHPGYKHGLYSRYSPAKWIESLQAAAEDPQLLDLRRDIELAEAGLNEALQRMDLGVGSDEQTAALVGSVRAFLSALDRGDQETSARMLREIPDLVDDGELDTSLKVEVQDWLELRMKLIAEESRVQHRLQLTVPLEEVGRQFDLLGNAIKTNINRLVERRLLAKDDANQLLQAISDDFIRVAGFERLPGDSADRD